MQSAAATMAAAAGSQKLGQIQMTMMGKGKSVHPMETSKSEKGGDDEAEKDEVGDVKANGAIHKAWTAGALGSVAAQVAAVAMFPGYVMFAAGGVAVATAAIVLKFQLDMRNLNSLRNLHNKLRNEISNFRSENQKLTESVDDLGIAVGRMKDSEQRLSGLVDAQGMKVDAFVDLVKENGNTLQLTKEALRQQVSQDLLKKALDSDKDGDLRITDNEVDLLILYLQGTSGVESIDEDMFRQRVEESDGSIWAVVEMLMEILDPNKPEDEHIIQLDVRTIKRQRGSRTLLMDDSSDSDIQETSSDFQAKERVLPTRGLGRSGPTSSETAETVPSREEASRGRPERSLSPRRGGLEKSHTFRR